jgi:hypothetical protein
MPTRPPTQRSPEGATVGWLLAHAGNAVRWTPNLYASTAAQRTGLRMPRTAGSPGGSPASEAEAARTEVVIRVRRADGGVEPLRWAWVYRRDGATVRTFHTDGAGRLFAPTSGARSDPATYTTRFTAEVGSTLELCLSSDALPLPETTLRARPAAFVRHTIAAEMTLPERSLGIATPADLTLWPLLWELPPGSFPTDGLPQGAALWTGSGLNVTEGGAAPAAAAAATPGPRQLRVAGSVDARATGVNVQLLSMTGTPIALRAAGAVTQEATATLGAASAGRRPYEALLQLDDPAAAFGNLQVVVEGVGAAQPELAVATVLCCGWQIALVDDHDANPDGRTAGAVRTAADDRVVVDFDQSPQATRSDIAAQSRARRMVIYRFANHRRRLDPAAPAGAGNPEVLKPQMPLWMAELQMIGVTRAALEEHLALRYQRELHGLVDPWTPRTVRLELGWRLTLQWDGVDSNSPAFPAITRHTQVYRHSTTFTATQTVTLRYGHRGRLTDASARPLALGADGAVPGALTSSTAPPDFPVSDRRRPQLLVGGRRRAWGRAAGAPTADALIVEYQPRIVDASGREIMRGGDGRLELVSATIDGRALPRLTATSPLARLPEFRVAGRNPAPHADVTALIDALVEERYNLQSTLARTTLLSLQAWKTTARRIFAHENGGDNQFEHRGAGRRRFGAQFYGHEADMPLFGPPHGYGFGQLDSPPTSDDAAWSFLENLRESIRRIMVDKAQDAFALISAHLPAPIDQRIRAVYQREIVRRYNGGREFQWNGSAWEIGPSIGRWADSGDHSKGANPRLEYPNRVLGTGVAYSVGSGAASTFPWPIAFAAAQFGPDT